MMPEITRFYGIIIKLILGNHPPPHFHAVYGEHLALFNIDILEMIEDMPFSSKDLGKVSLKGKQVETSIYAIRR